jgi:integrase
VFTTSLGTPLDASHVRRDFRALCKKAGIEGIWAPRELRHTFVSVMSVSGVAVEEIARLAGHSSSRTTEVIYRNSRELHQPGEKQQVSRSRQGRNSVPCLRTAAV